MLSDEILYLELPEMVASKRRTLGMTQGQLAEKANVSRHLVSDIENGHIAGTALGRLLAVLNSVGLSLEVVAGIPDPQPPSRRERPEDERLMQEWLARYRGDSEGRASVS